MKIIVNCLIGIILLFSNTYAQKEIKFETVSDRVVVARAFDDDGQSLNVTVFKTSAGLVVIDTCWPLDEARRIKEKIIEELGRDDFSYLINTHGHMDHCIGNQFYKDAVIIAHNNAQKEMKSNTENWPSRFFPEDFMIEYADITFENHLKLSAGELNFELYYLGFSHTDSHIFIHIPEENILCVGDCFNYEYLPWIDERMDVLRMINTLDRIFLTDSDLKTVIGGHLSIFSSEYLKSCRDYIKKIWDGVTDAKSRHLTLEETKTRLLESISFEAFLHTSNTEERFTKNIEAVWNIQNKG